MAGEAFAIAVQTIIQGEPIEKTAAYKRNRPTPKNTTAGTLILQGA